MATVVLASYSRELGGAELALLRFAGALPEDELWLLCPSGPLADAGRARGLRVAPLRRRALELRASPRDRFLAPARLAGAGREMLGLLDGLGPDLVVACGMRTALALVGCRALAGCGADDPPLVVLHNDLLPGPLIGAAVRHAARRSSLVVVPSRAVAEDLGVESTVIAPGIEVPNDDDRSPPAPAEPPEVLVVGALVPWKRPDLALEVMALVRQRVPEARLRLVGAPLSGADGGTAAFLEGLRARAASPDLSGAVEFCGRLASPWSALRRTSCLLHCADREPFGLVVAEALAAGRPVVVASGAGPAEILGAVGAPGEGGATFVPGDAAAAAAAVTQRLEHPLNPAVAERVQRRARERFSASAAARSFGEAVRPLLRTVGAPLPVDLALITVTHESADALPGLLASVARHAPAARVIVVDNASTDGTRDVVAAWGRRLPGLELIALSHNVGFGSACNRGLEHLDGERRAGRSKNSGGRAEPSVVALVNPDVELLDDSLLGLAARVAVGPAGLWAPLVLSADGRRQDTVHPVPGSMAARVHAVVPPTLVPGRAGTALAPWRAGRARRVGWAVGCALVAREDVLRSLGPFDERIFLYGEDLDLGLRAAAAGIPTWFSPEHRVLHHRAHTTLRRFGAEPYERLARARREVIAGRLGPRAVREDDAAQALTFVSRGLLKRALGRSGEREAQQLAALRAAKAPTGGPNGACTRWRARP